MYEKLKRDVNSGLCQPIDVGNLIPCSVMKHSTGCTCSCLYDLYDMNISHTSAPTSVRHHHWNAKVALLQVHELILFRLSASWHSFVSRRSEQVWKSRANGCCRVDGFLPRLRSAVLATLTDDVSSTKCTKINYISKMNHVQNISTCSGRLMKHVFQR